MGFPVIASADHGSGLEKNTATERSQFVDRAKTAGQRDH